MQSEFGAAVRVRRGELGMTLEQLAEASGVSMATLSRLERGALNPSLSRAVAIAAALGADLDSLLTQRPAITVVRRDAAPARFDADTGTTRRSLARPAPGIEVVRYEIAPASSTREFAAHPVRTVETFHVLRGEVTLVGDDVDLATLEQGDTAEVRGDHRHRIVNAGSDPAEVLLVITRPR